jgi:cellulose biosynthesis protein BcsQ
MDSLGTQAPAAYYVFNQFDDSNPSHQGARDLVARRCDQRLLPISIRRGPMAEALDARMTLADYAPASEVARDFLELALWLRRVAPIRPPAMVSGHWSER